MTTLRDKRQQEFANKWWNSGKHGILHLCPRFGKIRTSIHILNYMNNPKVLIAYPDNKIKESWKADFDELQYNDENVTYTTHLSLKKHTKELYDIVIIDEIHLLSEAQIVSCEELFRKNLNILGLTGTLSKTTEQTLKQELKLPVIAEYSIETGIKEGVITDYEITVITVPLDNVTPLRFGAKIKTEKKQFDAFTWIINKMQREYGDAMFMRLNRMRIIQNSIAKLNKTKQLLAKHPNERILVFCGVTKVADKLGIPSYHSKTSDKNIFTDFAEGKGNHLAVVRIGNTGITYKPLHRVIINYFDSNGENLAQKINRCMAFEYNNPDKKAHIYIISTNEPVELKWLSKALEFFDQKKIKYL